MIFTNLFLWKQLNWQKSTFSQVSGTQASILYRAVTGFIWRWWTFKSSLWPGAGGGYKLCYGASAGRNSKTSGAGGPEM